MIFDAFDIELDKGAALETAFMGDIATFSSRNLLQSLDNQIWNNAFKEDKLSFLIVEFRSLPEKPQGDKQDWTVHTCTYFNNKKINSQTIRFYWGTYWFILFIFFLVVNLHVSLTGTCEFLIMQDFCSFEKINIWFWLGYYYSKWNN